jgi:pimeloyl-ACP methyl ester carboxylesterase
MNHAKDCLALMDHLDVERTSVIGHSLGGYVARDMYLTAPDRIESIVEVDTCDCMIPQLGDLPGQLGVSRPPPRTHPSEVNQKRLEIHENRKAELQKKIPELNMKAHHEATPDGKWCGVPLLVFMSSAGDFSQGHITEQWVSENSTSEQTKVIIVNNSGHYIMLEHPEFFNKKLLQFLNEHVPGNGDAR